MLLARCDLRLGPEVPPADLVLSIERLQTITC